jgi:hypothetical protein
MKQITDFISMTLHPTFEQPGMSHDMIKDHPVYSLYAFSCFFYGIAGYIRLTSSDSNRIEFYLLMAQSILSYKSDVETIGEVSHWHLLDRYYATFLCIYLSIFRWNRLKLPFNFILFLIGFYYLDRSRKKYLNHSPDFMYDHIKWHAVAPILGLLNNY